MANAGMSDVLGSVLELTRLRGRVYCQTVATAPWGLSFGPTGDAAFHLVMSGTCHLFQGADRMQLVQGDVVLIPHGSAHALADHPRSRRVPLEEWLGEQRDASGAHGRRIGGKQGAKGEGAEAQILCGVYSFDVPGPRHPVMRVLPERVHVSAKKARERPELGETIAGLSREYERGDLGTSVIVSRLLDVLFVQILRTWVDEQPAGGAGWLGALRDSLVGAALSLMHDDLAAPWEVEGLAAKLGTSRATLARRFVAEVGVSPLVYLTQARMREAARLVRETDRGLAGIAEGVGYSSEFAFNRAFRREFGVAPGAFRRGMAG